MQCEIYAGAMRQCDAYAHKAAKQAEFNSQNNCGGTGPRWTQDRDAHFAWCTWGWENDIGGTNVVTAMAQERDARDAENARCQNLQADAQARLAASSSTPLRRQRAPCPRSSGKSSRSAAHPKTAARCRPGRPQGSDPRAAGRDRRKRRRVACKARGSARAADGIDQRTAPDQDRGKDRPARVEAQAPAGPVQAEMAEQRAAGDRGNQTRYGRLVSVKALPADPGHTARDRRNRGRDHVKAGHTAGDRRNGGASTSKPGTPPATGGTGGVSTSRPGTPPATGGTGGVSTSKPIPPVPSTPPATGGSGGINLTKPIPPAATPNSGSSDLYLRNSRTRPDSSIALRNKPLQADLFKPKGTSGLPPVKSYGTKADSPVAWKRGPIRPAISRPTASTGALPIRSNATAGSVATGPLSCCNGDPVRPADPRLPAAPRPLLRRHGESRPSLVK